VQSQQHPLKRWLFENNEHYSSFGERIGCSQALISFWIQRMHYPTMLRMIAIAKATNGEVMPNDFLPPGWNAKRGRPRKKVQ
jgi:DNA-binding transcriptional regulator YdaS (Cro superfamily)